MHRDESLTGTRMQRIIVDGWADSRRLSTATYVSIYY
jgi:hypothetical protein